jgi:hypothetical protein
MANLLSTTVNGSLNVQGSSMYVTASQLHIGKASSGTAQMSFESWGSYTGAIAMNSSGAFHWGGQGNSEWYFKKNNTYNGDYSASGTTVLRIASDGNIYSAYYGDWLSNVFNSKQNASTAITTSNIGSQSVNYANSSGVTEFQNIPDARGNAYPPNAYNGQRVWWHFNNTDTVGGYGTYWHAIQTVSPWTSYDSSHRQQQIQWGGTDISFRYATSGTTWSSWFRFITDANIGSQSVSNATTVGGLAVHTGRNNEANKIVRTQENGYVFFGYINSSNGNENNNSNPDRVWGTNGSDDYLRTYRTSALSVGYAASAGNANTLDSLDSSDFARGRAAYQVMSLDDIKQPGLYQYDGGIGGTQPEGADQANLRTIEIGSGSRYSQMAFDWASDQAWFRRQTGDVWSTWREFIHSGNIGSQSVASAGNADTVDGFHASVAGTANTIPTRNASGYLIPENWIQLNGIYGLYSPTNNAHLRPNPNSYGPWLVTGTRNGWSGIEFDASNGQVNLMINPNSNTSGFHNNSYGWQFLWEDGVLYCHKNSYGGGTRATVLDSSNFTSWGQEKENQRLSTGNSPTFSDIYVDNWFRNNNVNEGLYNQATGTHFYSNSVEGFALTGSGGSILLEFRSNHQSTLRGYVHANTSNQIGFLNNGGSWTLRTDSSKNAFIHGTDLTINADNSGSSNIFMNDGDEGTRQIHCNSNRIGFLTQGGSWGSWCNDDGGWHSDSAMYSPIYYDSNDTSYFLDPNADWSMAVYGEICNSNYAGGKMQPGALNIGRIDTNYAWDGTSWASDIRLGMLANCSETWEFGIHDSGDSVMSALHFDGGSTLTFGRNLGWGTCVVNSPSGYVSNGNPWNTANSAFFPNGITTAGGTNWIYGFTYIGNAPANGNGHEFNANGTQYSTTSITTPTFIVNSHSDNTRGYRIHNTSGSSVSAMFTNSANALVIGAGAFDQVQLNKKVLVSGAALGVNVAASATAGRIDASNDIVAYSSSDERLKHNITPIENALDKVKSLTGVEFDWKPEYKHAHGYEGHDTGIIAQQVQEVIPSAVRTNDTGFLAVRYEKLIGLLVEGMKEQQAQIDELKAKLDGIAR